MGKVFLRSSLQGDLVGELVLISKQAKAKLHVPATLTKTLQ